MVVKSKNKKLENFDFKIIFLRYSLILMLTIFFLSEVFVNIVSFILIKLSYYFLKTFTDVMLINQELVFPNGAIFLIVKECIATSAYILITLIFLSIPIHPKDIYRSILKSYIVFTIFNIIRIFILMFVNIKFGEQMFNMIHLAFYEIISAIGAAVIIIYYLRKQKIRRLYPFVSDMKHLIFEVFGRN